MPGAQGSAGSSLAVSVHGPIGVLDLVVPAGARVADVACEYAAQSGLPSVPLLSTPTGTPLRADVTLADAGVDAGDLLVATTAIHRPAPAERARLVEASSAGPGRVSALWVTVAAGLALLAGWSAASAGPPRAAVFLLLAAAVVGVLPIGRYAGYRALAAPAFGAAAALALAWDPQPEALPLVLGIAGLGATLTAAVARAVATDVEEGLRVWMVTGAVLFATSGLVAVAGLSATVTWSVLLAAAMLAARFVPMFAVDVPDQLLVDLDRLAVTAWSARERPRGRRDRAVGSPRTVEAVARRGARLLAAAGVAIAVIAVLTASLLLDTVDQGVDRVGARCLVFFAGAALLLAARSHRQAAARTLLRVGGLGCWGLLTVDLLPAHGTALPPALPVLCVALALGLVVAAVATGRGWRSVWWARRAELAEGMTGAAALASTLVASGFFREVWEFGSRLGR